MKVLVTGATGLVGNAIAKILLARGDAVRAVVRDPRRAGALVPGAEIVEGDITDAPSVRKAVEGVELVFHAAGMPEQWQTDDAVFDRVNRGGTRNVLQAALDAGVRRVIYTSTMDVFQAPPGGTLRESRIDPAPKHTAYERSKQAAEREAEALLDKGLDIVFVNPSAVYGPSPVHVALNSFFIRLMQGKVPLVPPGGMSVVYVDGCAQAHVAAAERGGRGERYLLADTFATNEELARAIVREAGLRRVPPNAPAWLVKCIAAVGAPIARATGTSPLIAPGQLTFLLWGARVDATKAQRDLGFTPRGLADGVRDTVAFLRREGIAP